MTLDSEKTLRLALDAADADLFICDEKSHLYEDDVDDERSVIEDACALLARSSGIRFVVTGFSYEPWPVDIETDLPVVLEQLPEAVTALRDNRNAAIDFYEQGLERVLVLGGQSAAVEIECLSRHTKWQAHPARISIDRKELLAMLVKLGTDFCEILSDACRELAANPWLAEWRRRLEPTSPVDPVDPDRGSFADRCSDDAAPG